MQSPFGHIFAEEIVKGKKTGRSDIYDDDSPSPKTGRFFIIIMFFILGMGFLLVKLFSLTVIFGEKYFQLSSENRIREVNLSAPRGIIYDRNGIPLVHNIPVFIMPDGQKIYESTAASSGLMKEDIVRDYITGADLAHILGFVGQADALEVKKYKLGAADTIGKMGVEKTYDGILRGTNGKTLVETDAHGEEVRTLGNVDPVAGKSLTLSLDLGLQKTAGQEMTGKKGAVIVSNPKTGEILALFSSPSFDPNKLIRNEDVEALFMEKDQPFFNRAISGLYPPGSTFKIVTSIAALESGAIDKNTRIEDTGILQVGAFSFGNWYFLQYGKKEGMVDIVSALKRSNDIFFYKTGEMTGIETISAWAKKIGLGKTLGIDIEGEAAGVMPDPIWRKKAKGTDWYLGDTYHVSIGQGDLQVTPLQVNVWTNVIASGGKLCRPYLVKTNSGIDISDGGRQARSARHDSSEVEGSYCRDLGIKKETIDLIREGMKEACSTGGTGWPLFNFKVQSSKIKADGVDFLETFESTISGKPIIEIPTACKTGTSEFGDPQNRTHAWFTVFAPVVNPQISVTVLVEAGGEGSNVAAPIAKKILEKWFTQ